MQLQQYDDFGDLKDQSETISDGNDRERTRLIHQSGLLSYNSATFTISTPSELRAAINVACHASLTIPENATYFSSCFDQTWIGDDPAGDAYYDWMTSDESPWRILFKYGKPERILPKSGKGGGFILDAKIVHELGTKWPLYNFMVAMRMVSEESDSIRTWYRMVDLGLHPADALYLSRMFLWTEYEGSPYLVGHNNNDGIHWPLSDSMYGSGDSVSHSFRRFREGDMNLEYSRSSGIWWDIGPIHLPRFNFKGEKDAGRSGQNFYAPHRVIDQFKEYLKGK